MDLRHISSWSIRSPILPLMLFVILAVIGASSFAKMRITQMPDVSMPLVMVQVVQPNAAPTEIETQVTRRVEGAVAGLGNVKTITSVVTEGSSLTNIEFHLGTPVDRAVEDVRNAVTKIRSDLPEGILEPQVNRMDIDGGAIAYVAVQSTSRTLEQLSWFIDNNISRRLVAIPGVAQVSRGGGVAREIRINLDPIKMQSYGITPAEVNLAMAQLNLDSPGGRTEIAGAEQSVRVLGGARTVAELASTRITLSRGREVRLSDIAEVHDASSEQRSIARLNGRQVSMFGLYKAKGASDVSVYDRMNDELKKLTAEYPDVTFVELFNSVDYTKENYDSAITAMWEGALLAVVVVFFFLRDWRATLISALAIPLSAIPAFWFMDMMGFTLNMFSLLALSLVAGILVDDAIVEIENIVRHMRMGKSPYQASLEAADEIGLAVVATTFSIIAVFFPVSFMPGISGQFFKQFGLTVAITVFMSLLVARTITPLIAAYFLSSKGHDPRPDGWLMERYMAALRWTIHHRVKVVVAGFCSFLLTIFLFSQMQQTFQPDQDMGMSILSIELPPGSTLEDTSRVSATARDILKEQSEVRQLFEFVGDDDEVRRSSIFVSMVPAKERALTTKQFERQIMAKFDGIPNARLSFRSMTGVSGQERDIVIMLSGDDPMLLDDTAAKVAQEMRGLSILRDARIDGDLTRPEILIRPRFDIAAEMGVSVAALSQTVRIATVGEIERNMAKFSLSDRQIPIRVSLVESARTDIDMLGNLPVPTSSGGTVPLKVVADISFGAGPTRINRYNQERRITLVADLNGVTSGTAMDAIAKLPIMANLPDGVQQVKYGEAEIMDEMISNFVIAIITGVLLVFAVLVLLYKKVLPPFVNMASLLLAPLGAVVALIIGGYHISMPVYIGLLMLMGIVAKNSILLVDFAIEEMRVGIPREQAILDAGHKRAKPITMTTVAMVAGMMPVALGLHGDASMRAPMAISVIGGLTLSTILTLLIVPAGFTIADDIEQWLSPRLGKFLNKAEVSPTDGSDAVTGRVNPNIAE